MRATRRFICLLSTLILVLCPVGCGSSRRDQVLLRADISDPVSNLDPLYADSAVTRMLLMNLFEGLIRKSPDGNYTPGIAQHYTLSADARTYTFFLREDSGWTDGSGPVTAQDFVFAFHRMFRPGSTSPHMQAYACIENSARVLSGDIAMSYLGVRAENNYTLSISLTEPCAEFLDLLTSAPAMPCRESTFDAARGRYGLERKFLQTNGPFMIETWNDKQIVLKPNPHYTSNFNAQVQEIRFYIGRENPLDLFLSGSTNFSFISGNYSAQVRETDYTVFSSGQTTWCIAFNGTHPVWRNPLIRQAFALSLEYDFFSGQLAEDLAPSSTLIPEAATVASLSFRAAADKNTPLYYDPEKARQFLSLGLEALLLESLPAPTLLVPETGGHDMYFDLVKQSWQKHLSVYANIHPLPLEQIERRLQSGDYELIIFPFSLEGRTLSALFSPFNSDSPGNYLGYRNPRYDDLLYAAGSEASRDLALGDYISAERMLLSDAVVIPVYAQNTIFAVRKGITGIEFLPHAGVPYFRDAGRA